MIKVNQKLWLFITVVFAIVLTTIALSHFVTSPWRVIPGLGSDSGKNIFTYLYHILYDKGIWFTGMNYPYGEHIVYTDGQPILSVPLSYCKNYLSIESALTIMYRAISLSYVLAIVYIFKILLHFRLKPLLAMLFAGLIIIGSPQIFRLDGHFALSYICIIPMMLYWVIQYHSTRTKKYPVFIFVLGSIAAFLHPYFAAVTLIFISLYVFWYLVLEPGTFKQKLKHVLPVMLSAAGVFLLFSIVMKLTDPATDRPEVPHGILSNCTHLKDIVTSIYSPIWDVVRAHNWFPYIADHEEGYIYLGLVVVITLTVVAFCRVLKLVKRRQKDPLNNNPIPRIWLFIAGSALVFSFGIPFIWHMEWLLDYVSALRQFRTLGRFGWIFYYIATIYGVVQLNTWYVQLQERKKHVLGMSLIIVALTIWGFEVSGYIQETHLVARTGCKNYDIFVSKNAQNWEQFLQEHHYSRDSFQAILVLRFFENGSEKLWLGHDDNISAWGVAMGIKAAIQLHLPIIDCMMSRTSWSQAFSQVKIAGGAFTDKAILRDIKSDKPFLLQVLDTEPADANGRYLIEASEPIGHFLNCTVYACYPDRIRANDLKLANRIKATLPFVHGGDTCIDGSGSWYAAHFNASKGSPLFGGGALSGSHTESTVVATIPIAPNQAPMEYEFSCWFLTPANNFKSPYCAIEVEDSTSKVIFTEAAVAKEATDNFGTWLRASIFFNMPPNARCVKCIVYDVLGNSYLAMDELMLRPEKSIIISKAADGKVMVNNHLFPASKP